jgi:iron complex outermembrane receptor protein
VCTLLYGQHVGQVDAIKLPTESAENESESLYELDDFIVVAERYGDVGDFSLVSVQVLEEADLQRQIQTTLGETLAWEPGLNASYFGPGASRPVIRGLGDYRVRMLVDDIGTLDVSDNSPDHAIPLEPLLIRRVDVHRGPDALLFGNAAIGGAINSQTHYLPESLPEEMVSGTLETRYETVSEARSAAIYTTTRADDFALRLTGSCRNAKDYDIPSRTRSSKYERTYTPEINNPSLGMSEPISNPSASVPNTYIDTETASAGLLWKPTDGRGRLGIAYSRYESAYGVPYQYGGDANELFGHTGLEMQQSRVDLDASWNFDLEQLKRVRLRFGQADYEHEETFTGLAKDVDKAFEDTIMGLESMEARVDVYHRLFDGLEGVAGLHGFERELDISRLTAPPILSSRVNNLFETYNLGYFLVETLTLDKWVFRGGYRYEKQTIDDLSLEEFGFVRGGDEESHSVALGITWRDYDRSIFDVVALTANVSRIERLPSETERYAFWSNPAIHRFIIGADNAGIPLKIECSNALELGLEAHKGDWSGRVNFYHYDFKDFIFLQDIKGMGNLSQYVAKDAELYGGEAELTWRVYEDSDSSLLLKGMVDWVRGQNRSDDTNLPRIPPRRIGSRVEYQRGALGLGADFRYSFKQNRVQKETDVVLPELKTKAYFELNLDATYSWTLEHGEFSLFARASNLLDVKRRTHVSFLKDVAPLPGRNLSLGASWQF